MRSFYKKIFTSSIIIMVVFALFCIKPQTASAQVGAGLSVPTFDIPGYTNNYILNNLANVLLKQLARQLTLSIVNWINSGFQGSPSFVQNPEAFFEGIGDNVAGNFIGGPGSPLAALCSPIALNVRLALAINQANLNGNPYACTLSSVINNVEGASINGFMAGDFSQGGWPAFASLAEPQNSFYGAYLQSQADLSAQINNQTVLNQNLLNQGNGFLSWQDPNCLKAVAAAPQGTTYNAQTNTDNAPSSITSSSYNIPSAPAGAIVDGSVSGSTGCPIETPGSFIAQQLNFAADSPLQQLDIQDNMNAIVNALFAQLTSQILSKGLGTISGSSASGASSNSYLSEVEQQAEANDIAVQQQSAQSISTSLSGELDSAIQAKSYVESSITLVQTASSTYNSALSYCSSIGDASVVSQIQNDINTNITPLLSNLISEDASDTAAYTAIQNFITSSASSANNGTLASDTYGGESNDYSILANGGNLISSTAVSDAQTENAQVQTEVATFQTAAQQYQNECKTYTANYNGYNYTQ